LVHEGPAGGRSESMASTGAVAGIDLVLSNCDVKEDAREVFRAGFRPPTYRLRISPGSSPLSPWSDATTEYLFSFSDSVPDVSNGAADIA
jgi:hypothetical protein